MGSLFCTVRTPTALATLNSSTGYIGRFAPSPSGPLHFGSLIAAVASYMQAIKHNGCWYVRIDDIDPPRIKHGATNEILALLQQCGFFTRDNGGQHFKNRHNSLSTASTAITLQSANEERYKLALNHLISRKCVYACDCTRRQLADHAIYPGTCRERVLDFGNTNKKPSTTHHSFEDPEKNSAINTGIRFRVNDKNINFNDKVFGLIEQNVAQEVGDFIVKRRDGLWSYQLATVVDDQHDRVSEVVRGADLLYNTPRQIALCNEIGLQQPDFLHVPVAIDSNGKKLSKQTQAQAINANQPLPALLSVWQFLGQAEPAKCETIAQFWQHAELSWDIGKIPTAQAIQPDNHEFR